MLDGPSDDPFGSLNLVGGLRRAMAKAGYSDLKEFQKVGLTVRCLSVPITSNVRSLRQVARRSRSGRTLGE